MKQIYWLVVVCLFCFSCQTKKEKIEKVEEDLYKCLMNSLNPEEEKKLNDIITAYETHLVEKGIISSANAEGYWRVYKDIANTGRYNFSNDFDFLNKVSFLSRRDSVKNNELVNCHERIFASEKYIRSNQFKLLKELEATGKADLPIVVAKLMIRHLEIEDFNLKYNRLNTLMFIERLK